MRLLVLLFSLALTTHAVEPEERERLRDDLSRVLTELGGNQERLLTAAGDAGLTVPAGVQVALSARRSAAEDWRKRVTDPAQDFAAEEVDAFREGVDAVSARLSGMVDLIGLLTVAHERWSGVTGTPEFARYRTFLNSWIEQGLREVAAGAEGTADEDLAWRRHRCHEFVLQPMDLSRQAAVRWPLVPQDTPVLREFLSHAQSLRAAAEARLQQPAVGDDADLERDEAIMWSLNELVQLVQTREERRTQHEIPADAPLWIMFLACLAGEEQSLRALIANRRTTTNDGPWYHRQEELHRERDARSRLSWLAWEALEIDLSITEQRRQLDELLADVAVARRAEITARLTALQQQRADTIASLGKGLDARARADAVRAKFALRTLQRDHETLAEDLVEQRDRTSAEQEWRSRAAEPGVAAALARLDAAWAAMAAARTHQREADHAAARADLARELAEVDAEVAQQAARRSREAMEQAQEALELNRQAVTDVLENPPPKPEGDVKF